ncbi:MAG: excisionase family DNA-binding protein [Candidatus Latescibacteria bacterium]|jgi:excisionase family DNA binding protein|nr:excisionase family DNA-binding protein [Gemmatimonadota bacterium]MBT5875159.1 excisionase family DNA-binding protein [Candidatus Latescibacterota bacterium]
MGTAKKRVRAEYSANGVPRCVLSVEESAYFLNLSRSKTFMLISSGEIPSFKCGRRRGIRIEDLEAFAANNTKRENLR